MLWTLSYLGMGLHVGSERGILVCESNLPNRQLPSLHVTPARKVFKPKWLERKRKSRLQALPALRIWFGASRCCFMEEVLNVRCLRCSHGLMLFALPADLQCPCISSQLSVNVEHRAYTPIGWNWRESSSGIGIKERDMSAGWSTFFHHLRSLRTSFGVFSWRNERPGKPMMNRCILISRERPCQTANVQWVSYPWRD